MEKEKAIMQNTPQQLLQQALELLCPSKTSRRANG